jgi:hypothetical protein
MHNFRITHHITMDNSGVWFISFYNQNSTNYMMHLCFIYEYIAHNELYHLCLLSKHQI